MLIQVKIWLPLAKDVEKRLQGIAEARQKESMYTHDYFYPPSYQYLYRNIYRFYTCLYYHLIQGKLCECLF